MTKPRSILCGGIRLDESDPLRNGRHIVQLNSNGPDANVNIRLMDLARVFLKNLSPRLEDLLEIASYVYSTDCATSRGGEWTDEKALNLGAATFNSSSPSGTTRSGLATTSAHFSNRRSTSCRTTDTVLFSGQ